MFINNQLTPFPYLMGQLNNISPLTYRDGATYLKVLEALIKYVQETQTVELQNILSGAVGDFQNGIANAENTIAQKVIDWQELFDGFMQNFVGELKALNDGAVSELVEESNSDTHGAVMALINAANAVLSDALNNKIDGETTALETMLANMETAYKDADNKKINATEKAQPNGVATLNAAGKVNVSQLTETTLSGNFSTRPLATAVNPGTTFYSLDTVENYRSNGTVWTRVGRGGYLGSSILITPRETTSLDPVEVPGWGVTFIAGSGSTKVTVTGDGINNVANGFLGLLVMIGTTRIGTIAMNFVGANKNASFCKVMEVTDLIPGQSYTVKVQYFVGGSGGTGKIDASTGSKATIIVESM